MNPESQFSKRSGKIRAGYRSVRYTALAGFLCLSMLSGGCSASYPEDSSKDASVESDLTDKHNDSGLLPNTRKVLEYVKDMDQLSADCIPFTLGSVFFANLPNDNLQLINAAGDVINKEEITFMGIMGVTGPSWDIQANFADDQQVTYRLRDGRIELFGNGGWGCARETMYYYNPQAKEVYEKRNSDNAILGPAELNGWPDMNMEDVFLVVQQEDVTWQTSAENPYYAYSYKTRQVYGPFMGDEVYAFRPDNQGIGMYTNCSSCYGALLPVLENGGYQLIGSGQSDQVYEKAQAVGMLYDMVQQDGHQYLIGPRVDSDPILLPDNAQKVSGIAGGAIMILQDGIWKLYHVSDEDLVVAEITVANWNVTRQEAILGGMSEQKAASLPDVIDYTTGDDPLRLLSKERDGTLMVCQHKMNVRYGPGIDYAEAAWLPAGTEVNVLDTTRDGEYVWGRILMGLEDRWICIQKGNDIYLKKADESSAEAG